MTIKAKKITEQEIEVKTPSYYKEYGTYVMITDKALVRTGIDSIMCFEPKKFMFEETALETIKWEEISEQEFYEEFRKVSDKINSLAGIYNVPTLQLQEA